MEALGFSINTLTLFGMVLAIGMVVDDAIVVVENVERHMVEECCSSKEAAKRAMREVTGPVIAIVLVLCAVFGQSDFWEALLDSSINNLPSRSPCPSPFQERWR